MDTIFAVSTAPGRAGISVIRLSGSRSFDVIEHLTGSVPPPRYASLRDLRGTDGELFDKALVICFEHGKSFTGERSAEIHCHGSPAVVQALLGYLSSFESVTQAEPGEFTRRALENGHLDLSQVEGLADLLDAETEAQRKQALRVFDGDLASKVEAWRRDLIRAVALFEATIDFADEEVPEDVSPEALELIDRVLVDLQRDVAGFDVAERIRNGFDVAIIGSPNVGKSTLFNMLAGREAAITSSFAGTTRDIIEIRLDLKGIPVTLLDTAGLREATDEIEKIGIDRARSRAEKADLRIFLLLPGETPDLEPRSDDIVLTGKADLIDAGENAISGLTGQGVPELLARLAEHFGKQVPSAGLAIRDRHRTALQEAEAKLSSAKHRLSVEDPDLELASEHLRRAITSLDSIVGRFDIEQVLDEIFSSFCLGK